MKIYVFCKEILFIIIIIIIDDTHVHGEILVAQSAKELKTVFIFFSFHLF